MHFPAQAGTETGRGLGVPRLRPALISINEAADYLGIARSTFYKDFLPNIETVRIGKRNLVVVESLDRLVAKLRGLAVA
jgi:hypothetical protein